MAVAEAKNRFDQIAHLSTLYFEQINTRVLFIMANESSDAQERDLDIPNGFLLNIKIDGIDIPSPVTSNYVGMVKNEYILINPPAPFATVKPKLYPGNKMVVQYLMDGTIFVFAAKIIDVLSKPIKVVVLEYPDKIINRILRSERRILCRIPSVAVFKGLSKNGIIEDININGCRLTVNYQPAEKNYIGRTGDTLSISCRLPNESVDFNINGTIRNISKKNLCLSYGIQFEAPSSDIRMSIEQYLEHS